MLCYVHLLRMRTQPQKVQPLHLKHSAAYVEYCCSNVCVGLVLFLFGHNKSTDFGFPQWFSRYANTDINAVELSVRSRWIALHYLLLEFKEIKPLLNLNVLFHRLLSMFTNWGSTHQEKANDKTLCAKTDIHRMTKVFRFAKVSHQILF